MAPVSAGEFARLVRGLSHEEFIGFVADIWRARGWTVTVDSTGFPATRPTDGLVERVHVHHRSRGHARPVTGESVDVIVSSAWPPDRRDDGRIVAVDDLRLMVLYSIDRDRATDLFETYFDRSITATRQRPSRPSLAGVSARVPDGITSLPSGSRFVSSRSVFVAVGIIVLFVAILGAGSGQFAVDTQGDTAPPAASAVTPVPEADATRPMADSGSPADGAIGPFPPGLNRSGITDARAIAAAHARVVTGQSYRLEITYREFTAGSPSAVRWERIRVATPTEYATSVGGWGRVIARPNVIEPVSAYANGTVRFVRHTKLYDSETAFGRDDRYHRHPATRRQGGEGRYADRIETYIEWFLSVRESTIAGSFERYGKTYYWVTYTGDPWPGVENTRGYALIDSTGIVHEIERRYDAPRHTGLSAVVTIRYTGIGTTTVAPPRWATTAQTVNHTAE